MGDENPIRTLGDYSKPSSEGYKNTIELPMGNNVVPLRSGTIRLVQNRCLFHGLRSEDPNQHLKDFLKLVDSLDLDGENRERTRLHKEVPVTEGSSVTTTERYIENYKNVSQDIRDQLNVEAVAVQIILTGIDNDIYSTVDACPNACKMWKAIERLKQGTVKFGNDQIAPILGYVDLTTPSSKRQLQLLHMDLCGPVRVASINGRKYVLVIVDDYSRYTWTHFLRSKDETLEVLIDFLRLVQRGLHAQVRIIRTDKGTEFLNKNLHTYFASEGILHQTSVARTPEQNGVVERQNRTLVEAARTMLSAAKVLLFFWAEAIATTCFTQNRSLVIPLHEKTPYHIINDRKSSVNFFYIFGSLCYIVRDGENLDKMKEKEIILFIVDSGCSKHMTGNLKLLTNFVEKFMGSVKYGNDQIAPILGYGDLGNDLLTGSRGTDLYSITLQVTSSPNPICLMAKATTSQAWLWHRRLSHLNFDTINLLLKNDIVIGLPKLRFVKDHLCSFWILHQTPVARTPEQNDVVGRRNRTLIEAARTMLSAAKVPLYFYAEAIATSYSSWYFVAEGILHQTSVSRTPEQNGVVERRNRTLVEAA
nr:retrovirus-related Pol polyprotein from transposon TNT 1-94 [Tanacetum cinerariifolium]